MRCYLQCTIIVSCVFVDELQLLNVNKALKKMEKKKRFSNEKTVCNEE